MPRRIADYPDSFAYWNQISSFGSVMSGVGFLFFFVIIVYSICYGDMMVNLRFRYFNELLKNNVCL